MQWSMHECGGEGQGTYKCIFIEASESVSGSSSAYVRWDSRRASIVIIASASAAVFHLVRTVSFIYF